MTAPMVDYKIHWLKMMSVPESRAVVGRHDGINGRDNPVVMQNSKVSAMDGINGRDRLNPPEWVERVDEPVPGYPKRPVARDVAAEKALKARTLTNLYNARPQWLADAHAALDGAVAAAYGMGRGHFHR